MTLHDRFDLCSESVEQLQSLLRVLRVPMRWQSSYEVDERIGIRGLCIEPYMHHGVRNQVAADVRGARLSGPSLFGGNMTDAVWCNRNYYNLASLISNFLHPFDSVQRRFIHRLVLL